MAYIDGFVLAVPLANKAAYKAMAEKGWPLFREYGATRQVETWQDDVPRGKTNDFFGAVQARDDEAVVFSWIEWPDKATRDAGGQKMMADERMEALGPMPFDGARMIYAGFEPRVDDGACAVTGYVDGFLVPVFPGRSDDYVELARQIAPMFRENGVARLVECVGDDVQHGKQTDFYRAAHAKDGEGVIFAWCEYADRAARDAAQASLREDERMKTPPADMPFDGGRMIFGGFEVLLDQRA